MGGYGMTTIVTHTAGEISNGSQKCTDCGLALQLPQVNDILFEPRETVIEVNSNFRITKIKQYATEDEWKIRVPCSSYYAE